MDKINKRKINKSQEENVCLVLLERVMITIFYVDCVVQNMFYIIIGQNKLDQMPKKSLYHVCVVAEQKQMFACGKCALHFF